MTLLWLRSFDDMIIKENMPKSDMKNGNVTHNQRKYAEIWLEKQKCDTLTLGQSGLPQRPGGECFAPCFDNVYQPLCASTKNLSQKCAFGVKIRSLGTKFHNLYHGNCALRYVIGIYWSESQILVVSKVNFKLKRPILGDFRGLLKKKRIFETYFDFQNAPLSHFHK